MYGSSSSISRSNSEVRSAEESMRDPFRSG